MQQPFSLKFARTINTALLLILSIGNALAESDRQRQVSIDFETMMVGSMPVGFHLALTGAGGPASWLVVSNKIEAGNSKVLVQTSSEEKNFRFPLCIYEDFISTNSELSVRFKPVSGEIDQAAGLVWRYQDSNNYYVVRANALEDNVVLYKMENGKRSDLKPLGSSLFSYGKDVSVPRNQWSTIEVVVKGSQFHVRLNGEHLFDVEDNTFQGAGKVGLWTKADSVTNFDDFVITSLDPDKG